MAKEFGGTKQHANARMDVMDRAKNKFPPLLHKHEVNYQGFKQRYDRVMSRIIGHKGASFGSFFFLKEMKGLLLKDMRGGRQGVGRLRSEDSG